jgi:phosphoglycolate phosphatase
MKYTTIIWDLDGTLLDTQEDLAGSVNYALAQNGFEKRSQAEVRQSVGNGIRNLIAKSLPNGESNPKFDAVFEAFRAHYAEHCEDKTKPYAGVPELLARLKALGIKMAIVSNKADFAVRQLAARYFGETIPVAIGESADVRKKPAPDSVFAALESLGSRPEEAVYIGDSEVDVLTAANAGLACVCVSWGFRERETLVEAGAKLIADTPEELREILESL